MSRRAAALCVALLGCAIAVPAQVEPEFRGTIAVVVPAGQQIVFGEPFALEVHHAVRSGWTAEPFDEQCLAPASLRREGTAARTVVAPERHVTHHVVDRYTARILASGEVVLPAAVVRWRDASGTVHRIEGQATKLNVRSILPDPPGDIEWAGDVRELPRSTAWLWLAASLLLAGLGAAGFLRWRSLAVAAPVVLAPEPLRLEPVLAALAALRIADDADPAAITAYYTALAEIVRGHAGRRFAVAAFVSTSQELLRSVPAGGAPLAQCLQACDLVKFAALLPAAPAHEAARAAAVQFVRATAPAAAVAS